MISSLCLPAIVLPDWFWAFEDLFTADLDLLVDEFFCKQSQQTDGLKMACSYAFVGFLNCFVSERGCSQHCTE